MVHSTLDQKLKMQNGLQEILFFYELHDLIPDCSMDSDVAKFIFLNFISTQTTLLYLFGGMFAWFLQQDKGKCNNIWRRLYHNNNEEINITAYSIYLF